MSIPQQSVSSNLFGFPQYRPPQTFSDDTRHLCGAAYIDENFVDAVLEEVVEDEHRAVAPSFGFDLDPIIRHCFRARRLLLARNALVAGLVVVGLYLTPILTVTWLLIGFAALAAQSPQVRLLPAGTRLWIFGILGGGILVLLCCSSAFTAMIASVFTETLPSSADGLLDTARRSATQEQAAVRLWTGLSLIAPFALAGAIFVLLWSFRIRTYKVLTAELAPGMPASRPDLPNERIARRVAVVAAAQYGNIVVQETDPFLGSGRNVTHGWNFALKLRPAAATSATAGVVGEEHRNLLERLGPELYQRIQEAVKGMNDQELPAGARVPNIHLMPYLVADGVRDHQDPLLHPRTRLPYTLAAPAAIEAIKQHPQAGLRYYERVLVTGAGNPVRDANDLLVLPAQDLGIDISAFIHVAAEGGMLYTEFIATVMPPVQDRYLLGDALHPHKVVTTALLDTVRNFPADTAASGWRALRITWHTIATRWRIERSRRASNDLRVYDYGARRSVRQLAAEPNLTKYLQSLDTLKYIKLIERAASDAIIGFLDENGFDTAEFSQRINHVQNFNANIYGGQQAFASPNSTFHQANQKK